MATETSLFEKFKETGKHGIVFGLGSTLHQLIALILLPIYTTYLTTSDYGILGLISITGQILGIIFALGLTTALFRSYYDYNEQDDRKVVISTAFFLIAITCCILFIFGIFSSESLSLLVFGNTEYEIYFLIIILTTIFGILNSIPFAVFRVRKESIKYVILQFSFFIIGISLIIYFVTIKNLGVMGVLVGQLITAIASSIVLFFYIRKDIVLKLSKFEAWKMIHFGAPLVLAGLSSFVFTYADRYMLNYYLTLSEVGLYTLGYQFGMVIMVLLITPTKLIWGPMFLSVKDDSNAKDFFSRALTYVFFIGVVLFLGLSLLSKEVIQIFANKEYWDAYMVIPVITLTYLIWCARPILEVGIYLKRKTKVIAWYFFIGATTNIILNLALIPEYGIMGAAYATLISFIVMIIIDYYYNRKYIKINYEWIRISKIYFVTALIFAIGYNVIINNLYGSIIFKIGIILLYPFILYITRFYTKDEIQRIKQIFECILVKLKLKHSANGSTKP